MSVLHERGAVLRLSVWDEDYLKDDFIGECFVSLSSIQPLRNLASLRDVPVSEVRLRRPHKSIQPRVFEVRSRSIALVVILSTDRAVSLFQLIRNRATFDEQAAVFLKQRSAVMQSGNGSDGASAISDDRGSTGSFTSSTLRSFLCLLPFHIGFGTDTTPTYNGSDVAADDELI